MQVNESSRDRSYPMRYTIALFLAHLALLVIAAKADASVTLTGHDCPTPRGHVPWRFQPDGCIIIKGYGTAILPDAATEVDIWSSTARRHLIQSRDTYPSSRTCPQWGFDGPGYAVGWVTCNQDIFNYAKRAVIAYYWEG